MKWRTLGAILHGVNGATLPRDACGSKVLPGSCRRVFGEELIGSEAMVNDEKARRELGYLPVITCQQGLAELKRTH